MKDDQPVLAADEIRHVGEPVALVAAPTLALARAARDHVRLRTEPLPPVLDLLASDHVFTEYHIARGDLEAGFAEADLVVEGDVPDRATRSSSTSRPQGMIAVPRPDGGVTVHGSLQCPYYVHAAMKRALGLDAETAASSSRRTPAAPSAARRSSRRGSPSTPRCWPSRSAARSA